MKKLQDWCGFSSGMASKSTLSIFTVPLFPGWNTAVVLPLPVAGRAKMVATENKLNARAARIEAIAARRNQTGLRCFMALSSLDLRFVLFMQPISTWTTACYGSRTISQSSWGACSNLHGRVLPILQVPDDLLVPAHP